MTTPKTHKQSEPPSFPFFPSSFPLLPLPPALLFPFNNLQQLAASWTSLKSSSSLYRSSFFFASGSNRASSSIQKCTPPHPSSPFLTLPHSPIPSIGTLPPNPSP
eukprot:TRINITY_DN2454_c0_g1_i1.p1 TRINITY_DN2454_c0_g1~~TRINITY_DN2454_c0_g1_i1.p1  ORF type:complete len:105 (-),score=2.85 TRINITY_DN2454_c0_g1_i1:83-397(-)